MVKILFICHGNICRSPMAEFVMKDLVKKAGLASQFHIESAATSREELEIRFILRHGASWRSMGYPAWRSMGYPAALTRRGS